MANEYARQKGFTVFSVYQGQWSAAERDVEREILPMCNHQGMAFIPYGVLGSGSFRTSAQRSAEQQAGRKREGRNIAFTEKPQKTVMADALEKIAIAKGISITSVALAWARTKGPYIFPVVGGRKVEHLKASIEALSLELSGQDIDDIEKAVPFDFGYPQTMLGGPGGATHPADVWVDAPQVSCPGENVTSLEFAKSSSHQSNIRTRLFSCNSKYRNERPLTQLQVAESSLWVSQIRFRRHREGSFGDQCR